MKRSIIFLMIVALLMIVACDTPTEAVVTGNNSGNSGGTPTYLSTSDLLGSWSYSTINGGVTTEIIYNFIDENNLSMSTYLDDSKIGETSSNWSLNKDTILISTSGIDVVYTVKLSEEYLTLSALGSESFVLTKKDVVTPTSVEGVWVVTKEVANGKTFEYSLSDNSKFLSNFVLILNNDGSGAVKSYGQFFNDTAMTIDSSINSSNIIYQVNGNYLMLNGEAYLFHFENNQLVIESSISKRYLETYSALLPPQNWITENIFSFSFHTPKVDDLKGDWKSSNMFNGFGIDFDNDSWSYTNDTLTHNDISDWSKVSVIKMDQAGLYMLQQWNSYEHINILIKQ